MSFKLPADCNVLKLPMDLDVPKLVNPGHCLVDIPSPPETSKKWTHVIKCSKHGEDEVPGIGSCLEMWPPTWSIENQSRANLLKLYKRGLNFHVRTEVARWPKPIFMLCKMTLHSENLNHAEVAQWRKPISISVQITLHSKDLNHIHANDAS